MRSLDRNTTDTSLWETYKQLELIPDAVAAPKAKQRTFTFGSDKAWRMLVEALIHELVYADQQAEYLERCWAIDIQLNNTGSYRWQQLWQLMK